VKLHRVFKPGASYRRIKSRGAKPRTSPSPFKKVGDGGWVKKTQNAITHIAVVGLGYVGLPLAVLAAEAGFTVFGIDKDRQKIGMLKKQTNYLADASLTGALRQAIRKKKLTPILQFKALKQCDAIFICLPTPVDAQLQPDISLLKNATEKIGIYLQKGAVVINESTVAIGTTREIIGRVLEKKSGLKMGRDFSLVCSPERVDPGTRNKTENIAKLIGGIDQQSSQKAYQIYKRFIKAPLITVESPEVAEGAKMLENSYRALNIALVNEFARLCEKINLDVLEVIKAASTKWSFQAHWPSLGTGGHCIPIDPYYLTGLASQYGLTMPALSAALETNREMPQWFTQKIISNYHPGNKVLLYGLAYKKNIKDLRESPALTVALALKKKNIPFQVYDPFYSKIEIKKLGFKPAPKAGLLAYDLVVVATDHDILQKDSKKLISKNTIVIDGKNYFQKKVGKKVIGVGRSLS